MKYRKKPVVIEATQWFKNGDHPEDHEPYSGEDTPTNRERYDDYIALHEGAVVRRFRTPETPDDAVCEHASCAKPMHEHGWIDTFEGGHIVCPGDFVITGVEGERYPCKPSIFAKTYEAVE